MHKEKLQQLLQEEKSKLEKCINCIEKFESINNIIQLKIKIDKKLYEKELYVDIKHLIDSNIESVKDERYCYDTIRFDIIIKYTEILPNKQKFSIAKFLERRLKNDNFDDEVIKSVEIRKKTEVNQLFDDIKTKKNIFKNLLKLLLCVTSYNVKTIIFTFLIILTIKFIVILPCPIDGLSIFTVKYDNYSDIYILNIVLNAAASLLELSDDFKLIPNNSIAVILMITSKIFIFLIFFNIIFKEIERRVFK